MTPPVPALSSPTVQQPPPFPSPPPRPPLFRLPVIHPPPPPTPSCSSSAAQLGWNLFITMRDRLVPPEHSDQYTTAITLAACTHVLAGLLPPSDLLPSSPASSQTFLELYKIGPERAASLQVAHDAILATVVHTLLPDETLRASLRASGDALLALAALDTVYEEQ